MKASNILAHRGWWTSPHEKNSKEALQKALAAGFGIETDIRDHSGDLVISHDMVPTDHEVISVDWLFSMIRREQYVGALALNIKSDGLASMLKEMLLAFDIKNYFFFDMSIPDHLHYSKLELKTFSRVSEYESIELLSEQRNGVWVDNFTGDFNQIEACAGLLKRSESAALVSDELHGREHEETWRSCRSMGLHNSDSFYICTDLPSSAANFFAN